MNKPPNQSKSKDNDCRVLVATNNRHKIREIRQLLGRSWRVFGLRDLARAPQVRETGRTFERNAALKARAARDLLLRFGNSIAVKWVVADDSGLSVHALRGAPGVRSSRYAGARADDARNRRKLLGALRQTKDRRAAFHCVLALAECGGRNRLFRFRGTVRGRIADRESGKRGFGYDPVFVPSGCRRSFGEMSAAQKNRLSHRAQALAKLKHWISR